MQAEKTQPWKSTNFILAVILAAGGLFVGFPEGEARVIVGSFATIIAAAGALREKLKAATVDWKTWLRSVNTWNYIATAVIAIFPAIPADLFQRLRDLADAALTGNWQGIATAMFSIGTMIYYLTRPKP